MIINLNMKWKSRFSVKYGIINTKIWNMKCISSVEYALSCAQYAFFNIHTFQKLQIALWFNYLILLNIYVLLRNFKKVW